MSVFALATVLMVLLVLSISLGTVGTITLRTRFDQFSNGDVPRMADLLHLDRDLYRAQRGLETALLETDQVGRLDAVGVYQHQVDRANSWWSGYSDAPAISNSESTLRGNYRAQHNAWVKRADALAVEISSTDVNSAKVAEMLADTQGRFGSMRSTVSQLEEAEAEPELANAAAAVRSETRLLMLMMLLLLAIGTIVGSVVSLATFRKTRIQYNRGVKRDAERNSETARTEFVADLTQALDMAQTESGAFKSVSMILTGLAADNPHELLLADSSQAHLKRMFSSGFTDDCPGCSVTSPVDCPAIRRGTVMEFDDGRNFATCPGLRDRDGQPRSGLCVPVSVAGRTSGVLHLTDEDGRQADPILVDRLREVADRSGDRLGVLRAFAQSQAQAATDPLTGMLNRRSFENSVSASLAAGREIAVAYCDLDHFKNLNDTYGHDAGDRALRVFSRVLTESLRDGDVAGRWGGEEFVVMFDSSDAATAAAALDRIRHNLSIALAGGTSPTFTASFGVADTTMGTDLEDLVGTADDALLHAKRTGRDRVVVAGLFDPAERVAGSDSESLDGSVASEAELMTPEFD